MCKVKCLNPISKVGTDSLLGHYELTDDINEAEAVLVRSADMKSMEIPEKVIAVARAGAGVNNIPLDRCAEQGVVVFNTPGANANSVKELAICAMLVSSRNVIEGAEWVRSISDSETIEKDVEKGKKQFVGCEISGKKLGIIGLGAIGAEVANAAVDLGMTTDKNKGMIGAKEISWLKKGCTFLNFSRDRLVDEDAMAEALEKGLVKAYFSDFANSKSVKMKNAIITPHLGASTEEAEDNCAVMAVKELMDYIDNGNIRNSVNFPNCWMGICQSEERISLIHHNIPNMIGQITRILASRNFNIANMTNQSRGDYAYTLLDLESKVSDDILEELKGIQGMIRVRIVKIQ